MRWSASTGNSLIVRVDKHKYVSDAPWPAIGGPGREVWTFKGLEKGTTSIKMIYGSVGLTGPPVANTLIFSVRVT